MDHPVEDHFHTIEKELTRGADISIIALVIGIIAILASIVIIAINPAKQFAQARNTQREAAVNAVLNAVGQRIADNKGVFSGTFTAGAVTATCGVLPTSPASSTITTTMAASAATVGGDFGCLVPTYMSSITLDPILGSGANTGYTVTNDTVGRVTICAPGHAESAIPDSTAYCVTR